MDMGKNKNQAVVIQVSPWLSKLKLEKNYVV